MFIFAIAGAVLCLVNGDAFNDNCVAAHNKYRAKHGAPALKFDAKAAAFAASWCPGMAKKCTLQHSSGSGFGENLAMAGSTAAIASPDCDKIAVTPWYNEVSAYNWNSPGFGMSTGHFTQVVWKATTGVGCAVATQKCGNFNNAYICCNYSPPGNYQGQFPGNVLKASG